MPQGKVVEFFIVNDYDYPAHIPVDARWRKIIRCADCGTPNGVYTGSAIGEGDGWAYQPARELNLRGDVRLCPSCGHNLFILQVGRRIAQPGTWWKPWTWFLPPVFQWRDDTWLDYKLSRL